MSIESGTKLGHYEISQLIGKGGMGEVYRAHDSKLGRDVAIKVLPDELARDEERLRRFQREAKVLAALNHPNIAAIYGLEHSGDTNYLVLELVPGETLAERISRGPIPIEEALAIAVKISEALEEAHEHGIVHRDLKPANIKLTPSDKVKVLDFGLAKALAEEGPESDAAASMSPTLTRDATRMGVILGTAAYMSPEQAKGKPVDRRTDVWAFGAVLFEMLTSRRAFSGDGVSDTLAAVLRADPDWSALPPSTPPQVERLLRRCLERDRAKRLGWVGDARLEIGETLAEPPSAAAQPSTRGARSSMTALLVAVLTTAGVVALAFVLWPDVGRKEVLHLAVAIPEIDGETDVALSPDGKLLAYTGQNDARRQIFLRRLDTNETAPLPGTDGARSLFFSPDGEWVGFISDEERALKKIAVNENQQAVTLATAPFSVRGASWSEDGFIYYGAHDGADVHRVRDEGGSAETVAQLEGEWRRNCEAILPGGRALLISRRDSRDVGVIELESQEFTILVEDAACGMYVPTGHLIFHRGTTLFAAPFDPSRLVLTGPQVPVLQNLDVEEGVLRNTSFSRTGNLAFVARSRGGRQLVRVDRDGRVEALDAEPGEIWSPALSPDGNRLALRVGDLGSDLWIYEWERDVMTRLTFDPAEDRMPLWTPDGKTIVFNSTRDSRGGNLYAIPADGSGPARRLTESTDQHWAASWSPDGKKLAMSERVAGDAHDISVLTLDADSVMSSDLRTPETLLASPFRETAARFSPDGRFLAYVSEESGQLEVYVQRFPGQGRWQVSTEGGNHPEWSPSSNELFYLKDNALMTVPYSVEDEAFRPGAPRVLFEGAFVAQSTWNWYSVFPDGEHFVMLQDAGERQLSFIVNWFEELERLAPTN